MMLMGLLMGLLLFFSPRMFCTFTREVQDNHFRKRPSKFYIRATTTKRVKLDYRKGHKDVLVV